jgi:hypothetical protein
LSEVRSEEAVHVDVGVAIDPAILIVAVDPCKVMNRVWVSNGAGLPEEPVSLPVSRGHWSAGAAAARARRERAGDRD